LPALGRVAFCAQGSGEISRTTLLPMAGFWLKENSRDGASDPDARDFTFWSDH